MNSLLKMFPKDNPSTRMLWAAEKGKEEVVKELIAQDCHLVNTTDKDQYSPLHRAAYENHAHIVQVRKRFCNNK